ncbi:MAG: flippase-like domain-containing protein [Myxococcales bacterium]|nr:flippase-like domain-containing protein [Myxococcales bacterium]
MLEFFRRLFANRPAMLSLSLAITALSLWLVFGAVRWSALADALRGLSWWPFAFSLAGLAAGTLLRAGRLRVLLRRRGVTFVMALETVLIGYLFTTLLPLRTGELLRIAYLGQRSGAPNATVLAAVGVERVADLIALALLAAVFLSGWAGRQIAGLPVDPWLLAALAGTGIFAALLAGRLARRRFAGGLAPAAGRGARLRQHFFQGIEALGSGREAGLLIGLSLALWLLVSFSMKIAFLAAGQNIPYAAAVVIMLGTCFAIALPSSPGFIGTYHLGFVAGARLAGIPPEVSLPVAIVFHLVIQVPFLPLGGIILFCQRRKLLAEATDG